MQHPDYPNDPNIILKPPLWVHDPDQTYDFFYINRMTDFFLLNPDFYYQFPIDLLGNSVNTSHVCYIMFDRATFDNYPWCDQYDVILYNYFKQFSGSDAYRTFNFLPINLKIEKPALIFPDDFSFNAVKNDLLLEIPPTQHKVVFTWLHKNTDTQSHSETICDKTYRIIAQNDLPTAYKLPCSEMLYGSLVIACEDSSVVSQIKSQLSNGYQYFLYENLSDLLNIFNEKINTYYGDDLHKIPQSIDFKQFFGYKVSTGYWQAADQNSDPNTNGIYTAMDEYIQLDSTSPWSFDDIQSKLQDFGYTQNETELSILSKEQYFYMPFQHWVFKINPIDGLQNGSPVIKVQFYNTHYPLMTNALWEYVPNWYQESCLLFCYPVSEKLAHFRIPENLDLQSSNIYYDGWWFYFLPPVEGHRIKRKYFSLNNLGFARIFSSNLDTPLPQAYIALDNARYNPDGTPKPMPDFYQWEYDFGTDQDALTALPYSPYWSDDNDDNNIQYMKKYLCYGIKGNFRLAIQPSKSVLVGNAAYEYYMRLNMYRWNWDNLILDQSGSSDLTWNNDFSHSVIWQKYSNPLNISGSAEEFHDQITGSLLLSNIQNLSDLQIDYNEIKTDLDFYTNWINYIMSDSQRIKEIHACLGASEYSSYLDENGDSQPPYMHIARRLQEVAFALGLLFKLSGESMSIRQSKHIAAGNTIPAGWPIGRFGTNQGGQTNPLAQQGGDISEERLGLCYEVKSNRFITSANTGQDAITQGGYVLVECLPQLLHIILQDLDKCLGLQTLGAFALPNPNYVDPTIQNNPSNPGNLTEENNPEFLKFEGLADIILELSQTLTQISQDSFESNLGILKTQAITQEILGAMGLPVCEKWLKLDVGGEQVEVLYPGLNPEASTLADLAFKNLANLSLLMQTNVKLNVK